MFDSNVVAVATQVLLLASCWLSPTAASPVNAQFNDLAERQSGGGNLPFPPPGFISANYMRANMRAPRRPGVFYNVENTVLNRTQIQAVAAQLNAVSLYDVYYPDSNYRAPFNPEYGAYAYYNELGELRPWFRYTSRIFAQVLENNVAYLIWDQERPFQNPNNGWTAFWASDEFDAIYRGQTAIDTIYIVNPVTLQPSATPIWRRGQPAPAGWFIPVPGANSESNATANPDPTGNESPPRKREPHLVPTLLRDRDVEPLEHKANIGKRAPNINGIEQDIGSIFSPGQDAPWSEGQCSFHFIQNFLDDPSYPFGSTINITLFDDSQTNVIGGVFNQPVRSGGSFALTSRLPYTLVITPNTNVNDPVQFNYANLSWTGYDPNCSTGGYAGVPGSPDSVRNGDCSFRCNQFQ